MKKQLALWVLFGLVFVVNPNLACSSSGEEDDFSYTEQDMKAVVLGEWQGMALLGAQTIPFTLTLEQASSQSTTQSISAPSIRPQCAQRSFVKPAAACASISTLPLVGTLESTEPALTGVVTGNAMAGLNLLGVSLDLTLADGRRLSGMLEDQAILSGDVFGDNQLGSFTLSRP